MQNQAEKLSIGKNAEMGEFDL